MPDERRSVFVSSCGYVTCTIRNVLFGRVTSLCVFVTEQA